MCDACRFKQYCDDCKKEQDTVIEVVFANYNSSAPKNNNAFIEGEYLHHKGRVFHIYERLINKKMPQKSILQTFEGFLFHIRDLGNKLVVTKIIKTKPKNQRKPDCPECQKIFIGKIPHKLLADPNW